MKEKNIIKIVLLVLICSLLSLFVYINNHNNINYDPELRFMKCSDGSIVNFTRKEILVCGMPNPYLIEDEIQKRNSYNFNLSEVIINVK